MPLNPNSGPIGLTPASGRRAAALAAWRVGDGPAKGIADGQLARFRQERGRLARQVRDGDITPKAARAKLADVAGGLKAELDGHARLPEPRFVVDRIADEREALRARAGTPDGLLRANNDLLRRLLVATEMPQRAGEFEAVGYTTGRNLDGSAHRLPSLDRLVEMHDHARRAGDDTAREWSRRELTALRTRLVDDQERMKVDRALYDPEVVSPGNVERVLDLIRQQPAELRDAFVGRLIDEAQKTRNADGFVIAARLAAEYPPGQAAPFLGKLAAALSEAPDDAIDFIVAADADARQAELEARKVHFAHAAGVMDDEGRLEGVRPPTEAELQARAEGEKRTADIAAGKPIGLAAGKVADGASATAAVAAPTT